VRFAYRTIIVNFNFRIPSISLVRHREGAGGIEDQLAMMVEGDRDRLYMAREAIPSSFFNP
jgi:hypothetical protein